MFQIILLFEIFHLCKKYHVLTNPQTVLRYKIEDYKNLESWQIK